MEHKGYITEDGRVVQDRYRAGVAAELGYKETRYNLRRVLVSREWVVRDLETGFRTGGGTRREAVEAYMAWRRCTFKEQS